MIPLKGVEMDFNQIVYCICTSLPSANTPNGDSPQTRRILHQAHLGRRDAFRGLISLSSLSFHHTRHFSKKLLIAFNHHGIQYHHSYPLNTLHSLYRGVTHSNSLFIYFFPSFPSISSLNITDLPRCLSK